MSKMLWFCFVQILRVVLVLFVSFKLVLAFGSSKYAGFYWTKITFSGHVGFSTMTLIPPIPGHVIYLLFQIVRPRDGSINTYGRTLYRDIYRAVDNKPQNTNFACFLLNKFSIYII